MMMVILYRVRQLFAAQHDALSSSGKGQIPLPAALTLGAVYLPNQEPPTVERV
eukprot:CAMPEP_0177746778 /NCGR_PEP_ID=MMETSP0484_2-20121128/31048_1 /TAXON_ID=354590 /ORGANISM="Rhodomonas lens, Strain RHODO" /LENGTH=52 /DNA_ID=CAMNT_0019261545 /DNA_START=173 /DNA_END=331 /DNA_ORIENTATION=-